MLRWLNIVVLALGLMLLIGFAVFADLIASPKSFFTYHTSVGWLTLYSDEPYDDAAGQRVLNDVTRRLATTPLDDLYPHTIYVANSPWKQRLFFAFESGAAGVNFYPVTTNVFIRPSDIDRGVVFGPSGVPAQPPRTLSYYAAQEITYSLTGAHLGARNLWNFLLPQWVREGYADYVGLGGQADIDDLYRRYRANDAEFADSRSARSARFLMLAAYMLRREHWTVDQLLDTRLSLAQAQAVMDRGMAAAAKAAAPSPSLTSPTAHAGLRLRPLSAHARTGSTHHHRWRRRHRHRHAPALDGAPAAASQSTRR